MIKLNRPPEPALLGKLGPTSVSSIRSTLTTNSSLPAKKRKKITFERNIYSDDTVKSALLNTQGEKCCFCESAITHIASGDIEHFRPKAAWRNASNSKLNKPGYYWLAYTWENLMLSCESCNRRHKKNTFPLESEATRCTYPNEDTSQEQPVFIDPYREDPENHISFRAEYPTHKTRRGSHTIKGLRLDRKELETRRRTLLRNLKASFIIARGNHNMPKAERTRAENILKLAASPTEEYSSCVRCAIATSFHYVL